MNVLNFPIKTIIWGVYSSTMKAFINSVKGKSDVFDTWDHCNYFIVGTYGHRGSELQGIYPRPKRVLGYKEMSVEEV